MIIVIEQNTVFSIEVYEGRHLRLYSQSTVCRLSQAPPANSGDAMQGSAFVHWVEMYLMTLRQVSLNIINYPIFLLLLFN